MPAYLTIAAEGTATYEEKKSVFSAFAAPIKREAEALALLQKAKSDFPDAKHHVYAYLLRSGSVTRYSDDHEPAGTAGMPVLDAMRKSGVTDAAIVVVRYFGGTLLGTGGLVRAYGGVAAEALRNAGIVTMREYRRISVKVSYPDYPKLTSAFSKAGIFPDEPEFTDCVRLRIAVPEEDAERSLTVIREATSARAEATPEEIFFGSGSGSIH